MAQAEFTRVCNDDVKTFSLVCKDNTLTAEFRNTLHGKIRKSTRIITGKNIGQKNATTAKVQALKEFKSLCRIKQIGGGYDLVSSSIPLPRYTHAKYSNHISLCTTYCNESLSYPVMIQPKLDGIRCLVYYEPRGWIFLSKGNKYYTGFLDLEEEVSLICDKDIVYDGELLSIEPFPDVFTLAYRSLKDESVTGVTFNIFDCFIPTKPNMKQADRLLYLERNIQEDSLLVNLVPCELINNKEELASKYAEYINNDYEGIVIRTETPYTSGRTKGLFKLRPTDSAEFRIIDWKIGKQNKMYETIWICQTNHSPPLSFTCTLPKIPKDMKFDLLTANSYINKFLTIDFQGYNIYGIPQFPVGKNIRNYE